MFADLKRQVYWTRNPVQHLICHKTISTAIPISSGTAPGRNANFAVASDTNHSKKVKQHRESNKDQKKAKTTGESQE